MPMPVPVPVTLKSKFFPRPYQPDIDGPPIFMLDEAKEKLFSFSRHLSYTTLHEQLCLLTDSPGYAAFFLTYLDRYERLLDAKPVLIQGTFFPPRLSYPNSVSFMYQNAWQTIHGRSSLPSCSSTRPRGASLCQYFGDS